MVLETIACPIGTLYHGDVGVGGVCDWADLVTCSEQGSEGSTTVMPVRTETIEVDVITTVPTVAIDSSGNGESVASTDNPNNFYCGSSNQMHLRCASPARLGLIRNAQTLSTYALQV